MENNLYNFDIVDYLENYRAIRGVKQKDLCKVIGCSETNYSNKVSRKNFNINEILSICAYLDIDFSKLKNSFLIKDSILREMLENLSYRGINNYAPNKCGFTELKKILDDKNIMFNLDNSFKFECGFHSVIISKCHNCYGIDESTSYFENLFSHNYKLDLNFMAGVFFACFFDFKADSSLYFFPKYIFIPKMIKYLFNSSYTNDELIYILNIIENKTSITKEIGFYIAGYDSIFEKHLPNYKQVDDKKAFSLLIKLISTLITSIPIDPLVNFELEKFLLKLDYIGILSFDNYKRAFNI